MKRATLIALFVSAGCGGLGLSSSESALVSDNETVDDTDDSVESGVEEPLSTADPSDPGAVDPTTNSAQLMTRITTNPGRYFTPAGCITTTVAANVATSVFVNCKGPLGLHTYNGTVVSTWTFGTDMLTVTHQATSFKVDAATLDHNATIVYTKTGSVYSRHRSGTTTGTTAAGAAIDHTFDYTATYDSSSKCVTRDGSSSGTLGGRELSGSITGYQRCGIGELGCPKSGTISLSREKPLPALTLSLTFPGGATVDVTRPGGVEVQYPLLCNPNN